MAVKVLPWGDINAEMALVGEAPGRDEERLRVPFIGQSGRTLTEWWQPHNLRRENFRIFNVYPYKPPGNKIELIDSNELSGWGDVLINQLTEMPNLKLIVSAGAIPLAALMRKPFFSQFSPSIMKYRGYVLQFKARDGRLIKWIPTIHPAATMRTPSWVKMCKYDWRKIAEERHTAEPSWTKQFHCIFPSKDDKKDFFRRASLAGPDDAMSIDIETPGGRVFCVSFALDPFESIVLPFEGNKKLIKALCALPVAKVLQNGHFDWYYLKMDEGIELVNYKWDTLAMHHAFEPEVPHSLCTQASIYTKNKFWKHMRDSKDDDRHHKVDTNLEVLYEYNGIDACVTRELWGIYKEILSCQTNNPFSLPN